MNKQFYGIKYPFVSRNSENYFVDLNYDIKSKIANDYMEIEEIKKLEVFNYTYKKDKEKTPQNSVQDLKKFMNDKESHMDLFVKKDSMTGNYSIQDFYSNATDIIRKCTLGEDTKGHLFTENGMFVYDVEVFVDKRVVNISKTSLHSITVGYYLISSDNSKTFIEILPYVTIMILLLLSK